MVSTLPAARRETERQSVPASSGRVSELPSPSGLSAKAELPGRKFRAVVDDTLQRTTSQKNAAADIGISEGRLSSKLDDGSLTVNQLEAIGPGYLGQLGDALVKTYGTSDPKVRIREELKQARAHLDRAFDLFSEVA